MMREAIQIRDQIAQIMRYLGEQASLEVPGQLSLDPPQAQVAGGQTQRAAEDPEAQPQDDLLPPGLQEPPYDDAGDDDEFTTGMEGMGIQRRKDAQSEDAETPQAQEGGAQEALARFAADNAEALRALSDKLNEVLEFERRRQSVSAPDVNNPVGDGHEQIEPEEKPVQITGVAPILVDETLDGFIIRQATNVGPAGILPAGGGGEEEGGSIRFGKPTSAYSSGATIELNPCDIDGTDNGDDNVTVNITNTTMPYSTTIPTTAIVPFMLAGDGEYYILGTPKLITWHDLDAGDPAFGMRYSDTTHALQMKVRVDFGTFQGTVSDWQDVITMESQTVVTGASWNGTAHQLEFTRETHYVFEYDSLTDTDITTDAITLIADVGVDGDDQELIDKTRTVYVLDSGSISGWSVYHTGTVCP